MNKAMYVVANQRPQTRGEFGMYGFRLESETQSGWFIGIWKDKQRPEKVCWFSNGHVYVLDETIFDETLELGDPKFVIKQEFNLDPEWKSAIFDAVVAWEHEFTNVSQSEERLL